MYGGQMKKKVVSTTAGQYYWCCGEGFLNDILGYWIEI